MENKRSELCKGLIIEISKFCYLNVTRLFFNEKIFAHMARDLDQGNNKFNYSYYYKVVINVSKFKLNFYCSSN